MAKRESQWAARYPNCRGCIYFGNDVPCEYFFLTGKTPQSQGVRLDATGTGGCVLKETRNGKRGIKREPVPIAFSENCHRKPAALDRPEVFAMHDKGALDVEIAAEMGVDLSTVISWRRRHNLPRNGCAETKKRIDYAEVEMLYKGGANDKEIADAMGVSSKVVWKWRHDKCLPANRGLVSKIDNDAAQRLYNSGASDAEIGAALGVSRKVVFRWREKRELPANYGRRKDERLYFSLSDAE